MVAIVTIIIGVGARIIPDITYLVFIVGVLIWGLSELGPRGNSGWFQKMNQDTDVLIIGACPTGLLLACKLARYATPG